MKNIFLFVLLFLPFIFSQTSSSVGTTSSAGTNNTIKCEDISLQDTCHDCFLYGPGNCGYCIPRDGSPGCYTKQAANSLPVNSNVCNNNGGNIQGDRWIASAVDCDEPCMSSENEQCDNCVDQQGCGFCNDGSGCITSNPTGSGPWIANTFSNCKDWRYRPPTSNYSAAQFCGSYANCSSWSDCSDCAVGQQGFGVGCIWCSLPNYSQYKGKCIVANSNANCAQQGTGFVSILKCPQLNSAGILSVILPLITFFSMMFFS